MKILLCYHNTQGLKNDARVVEECFTSAIITHVCYSEMQLYKNMEFEVCDLIVFFEHIHPSVVHVETSVKIWFFPNVEWLTTYDIKLLKSPLIDTVCCKNQHTVNVMQNELKVGEKSVLTKFSSPDRCVNNSIVPRRRDQIQCVHVKGVSKMKNSQAVFDAWKRNKHWPMLHIVCAGTLDMQVPVQVACNITLHQYQMSDSALSSLMSSCKIHVCPSYAEGYGHYINEARSCNSFIVTVDGAPMNEFIKSGDGIKINVAKKERLRLLTWGYALDTAEFEDAFENIVQNIDIVFSTSSRNSYLDDLQYFKNKMFVLFNGRVLNASPS